MEIYYNSVELVALQVYNRKKRKTIQNTITANMQNFLSAKKMFAVRNIFSFIDFRIVQRKQSLEIIHTYLLKKNHKLEQIVRSAQ